MSYKIILEIAKKLRNKQDYQSPEEVNFDIDEIIIVCENEIKCEEVKGERASKNI